MAEGDEDIDLRRRRCLYRAMHRGTKEMDWLLGRYAEDRLPGADADQVLFWERLVAIPDPQLYDWIMGHAPTDEAAITSVVAAIRAFHRM